MRDIEDGSDIYKRQCQKREDEAQDQIYALLSPIYSSVGAMAACANILNNEHDKQTAQSADDHASLLLRLLLQLAWRGDLQHAPVWQEFVRKMEKPLDPISSDPRTAM